LGKLVGTHRSHGCPLPQTIGWLTNRKGIGSHLFDKQWVSDGQWYIKQTQNGFSKGYPLLVAIPNVVGSIRVMFL